MSYCYNHSIWELGQEDEKFKVILTYIRTLKPAMATRDPVAIFLHHRKRTVRSRDIIQCFLPGNLFLSELDPLALSAGALFCIGPIILAPAEQRNNGHINPSRTHARD